MGSNLCISSGDDRKERRNSFLSTNSLSSPISKSFKTKGFDNNRSQECFANAFLQCLFHIKIFRETLKTIDSSNEILKRLQKLFKALDEGDQYLINKKKEKLFEAIKQSTFELEIFGPEGGDSRFLFQELVTQTCGDRTPFSDPLWKIFSKGEIIKTVTCKKCPKRLKQELKFTENLLLLNVQADLYYENKLSENFFLSESELRFCKNCERECEFTRKIELTDLPSILALRIEDNPSKVFKAANCKPPKDLILPIKGGETKKYEFVAAVYNTHQGHKGEHSVAFLRTRRSGRDEIKCANDLNMRYGRWEEINGFAKLVFYCEILSSDLKERNARFN